MQAARTLRFADVESLAATAIAKFSPRHAPALWREPSASSADDPSSAAGSASSSSLSALLASAVAAGPNIPPRMLLALLNELGLRLAVWRNNALIAACVGQSTCGSRCSCSISR